MELKESGQKMNGPSAAALYSMGLKNPTSAASLMHIYTVWTYLKPAARAEIAAWGDRDYNADIEERRLPAATAEEQMVMDSSGILTLKGLYGQVTKKRMFEEDLQVTLLKAVYTEFLATKAYVLCVLSENQNHLLISPSLSHIAPSPRSG